MVKSIRNLQIFAVYVKEDYNFSEQNYTAVNLCQILIIWGGGNLEAELGRTLQKLIIGSDTNKTMFLI